MDFVAKWNVMFIIAWAGCQTWIFS